MVQESPELCMSSRAPQRSTVDPIIRGGFGLHEFSTIVGTLLREVGAGRKCMFDGKIYRTMADVHQLFELVYCGNDIVTICGRIEVDLKVWRALALLPIQFAQIPNYVLSYYGAHRIWGHSKEADRLIEGVVQWLKSR